MNALQIFENPEFGRIRTVEVEGEPWLVGKDVAHMLNLNVPALPYQEIKGVRWAPQGNSLWLGGYEERYAPDGRRYFWCTSGPCRSEEAESDFSLLQAGYVTVTPLTYLMTHREAFPGRELTL